MSPIVRILVVTDDQGGFLRWVDQPAPQSRDLILSRDFHLGEFLKVLTETSWVGFNIEITKAHRDGGAGLAAQTGADVVGFRFDAPFTVNGAARTLADYDMALFFPIAPGEPDSLLQKEADAIAQFMEKGGGFFATGDHANLGSPLCGLLPRVRSMRRWWATTAPAGFNQAPSPIGSNRIDTTRVGPDGIGQFEDQSDEIPQPIAPTWYGAGLTVRGGYPASKYLPHPLLCSPNGVVNYLPDHMHEGICEVPNNLAGRTFKLNGATKREYPDYAPSGASAAPLAPEIVATGTVLPGITSPALDPAHFGGIDPANARTFGVIGAWDGHRVGHGRVVVDSTWHHFFDINLTGDRFLEDNTLPAQHQQKLHGFYVADSTGARAPTPAYQLIMWYFRNIVYWLIPANRYRAIWWFGLLEVLRRPRAKEEIKSFGAADLKALRFDHLFRFGQLAEEYFAQARGHCASYDIHRYLFEPKIPWWEWIQRFIDVWQPIEQIRVKDTLARERLAGVLGFGPRPEIAATLSLGAALASLVIAQRELGIETEPERTVELAQKHWRNLLNHAVSLYGEQLQAGRQRYDNLLKIIAEQLAQR